MKRQLQALTTDRLFHSIDRNLTAPLREEARQFREQQKMDLEVLRVRIAAAEQAVNDLAESLEPRVLAVERTVHDLVGSLEPRVALLEEAVFSATAEGTRSDPPESRLEILAARQDRLAEDLDRRATVFGTEANTAASALGDLLARVAHLETMTELGSPPE